LKHILSSLRPGPGPRTCDESLNVEDWIDSIVWRRSLTTYVLLKTFLRKFLSYYFINIFFVCVCANQRCFQLKQAKTLYLVVHQGKLSGPKKGQKPSKQTRWKKITLIFSEKCQKRFRRNWLSYRVESDLIF